MSVSDVFEGTPSFVSNILKWNSGETFNSYSGQHLHKYTFNLKGLQFEKICLKSLRSFEIEIHFVFFHQSSLFFFFAGCVRNISDFDHPQMAGSYAVAKI